MYSNNFIVEFLAIILEYICMYICIPDSTGNNAQKEGGEQESGEVEKTAITASR